MDILYSSSDSYAFLTGISILSLLKNNVATDKINIYIMDNQISEFNKQKLTETVHQYEREIFFVPMPDIRKLTGRKIETGRWNISTFGRLFMASALPKSVHTVLNIDCDTIIEGSLEEIFSCNVDNVVYAGVAECINYRYRRNIGLRKSDYYFNAGIVYLNLDEIRRGGYEKKFIDCISKYGNTLAYLDQDVLNSVIPQYAKKRLPLKFDVLSIYYYTNYNQLTLIRRSKDFYSENEYNEAKKSPVIVHFTTCFLDGLRPWIKGNKHPYLEKFLEYKSESLWSEEQLWEDSRSIWGKMKSFLIKICPMYMVCLIASLLHGVIVPNKNYYEMRKQERLNE